MRSLALLLTLLTGFSGLVYEVTWQKYFASLLGSHSEATASVLGIFLAGLSLGYALFGRITRRLVERARGSPRPAPLLRLYGFVELWIGLYALAFPWLFELVRSVSYAIPHSAAGLGFLFDVGLVTLLLGPPTILMGATVPVLTQALSRDLADATRIHALIYGINTAGAFAGALLGGFVLIPSLGLAGCMSWLASINLGAGLVFLALGRRPSQLREAATELAAARHIDGLAFYLIAALLSGFAMMVIQNVVIRLAGLALGSSEFTFSTVVAVFVLSIAIGSFAVSLVGRIPRLYIVLNQVALVLLLALLYPRIQEAPYFAHLLRIRFGYAEGEFFAYYLAAFVCLLALIGPAAILSGATLPLIFHHLRRETGDLGAVAGRIYSWNTLGALFGALLGGYALLFVLDLHHVYRIAIAALIVCAALLAWQLHPRVRRIMLFAGAAPCLIALSLMDAWNPEYLSMGLFRKRSAEPSSQLGIATMAREKFADAGLRVVFYDDDPISSITVVEADHERGAYVRAILSNGKPDGGAGAEAGGLGEPFGRDYPTMALAGLVPAVLALKAERAFVIGLGTGITVGELASLDEMQEVVVAEISPAVIAAAPLFDFVNRNVSGNPKVEILRSDAYRALMRSEGGFDIIVSEPSNPWVTGVEMLYSQEFLRAARQRLAPGGVFVQWYHQYETDAGAVALVLRTYASVFERVAVWYASGPDLLVLGFQDSEARPSLERIRARFVRPDIRAGMRRASVPGLPELLAHELVPIGVIEASDLRGPVHTLYHPILNHVAGPAFFRGASGSLPPLANAAAARAGQQSSLLGHLLASLPESERAQTRSQVASQACLYRRDLCAVLLAEWASIEPGSRALAQLRSSVRSSGDRFGGAIQPELIGQLRVLFTPRTGPGSVPLEVALRATSIYRALYQFAAPFDPEALIALWERCEGGVGRAARCAEGLAEARSLATRAP